MILLPATLGDAQILLRWRNDPETRAASRNPNTISYKEHSAWLARALSDPACVIRIANVDRVRCGVVRVDRSSTGGELSWTVSPEFRRRGIGREMVVMFSKSLSEPLRAVIRVGNAASEKIAHDAGFQVCGSADAGFLLWVRAPAAHRPFTSPP